MIGQYAYAGRLEDVVPSRRSARPPLPPVADNDEVVVAGQFHEHGGRVAGDDEGGGLNALLVGDCLGLG